MNTSDNRNALPIGYRLGDYQIQGILGEGGFGITYLAKHLSLNASVAIKEYFPSELAVRDGHSYTVQAKSQKDTNNFAWGLDRFIQEAQTLAQFKHPNIVRVLHFFQALHTAYIVMEYEEGQNLASLLQNGETADEEEIMVFLPALLSGLEVVHQAGYLHRDIKPANIYLRTKDQSPLLIDFGAARYELGSRSRSITTIVTPGYAPFEQYQSSGNQQGPWTDIYALGAVLYRLISGKIPPEAPERVSAMIANQPEPLTSVVKMGSGRYSKTLLEGIEWALAVKDTERPQSVKVWREKLLQEPSEDSNKPSPQTPVEVAVLPTPTSTGVSPSSSQRGTVIGVGLVLILLVIGGWTYYQGRQAHLEKQHQVELERQRQAELERQRQATEAEQQRQAAELERQRQIAELERQRQIERERQRQATEAEQQRQAAELERQRQIAELERQRQIERERQRQATEAEQQRQAAELERQRQAAELGRQRQAAELGRQNRLREQARSKAVAFTEQLLYGSLRIITGAGVRLREAPREDAKKITMLQIGTVVSELEETTRKGEDWYQVRVSTGEEGWIAGRLTMELDRNEVGETYIRLTQQKLNSGPSFGDLVDLCNFLSHAEYEVELEKAVVLKMLRLVALQKSLERNPSQRWINEQSEKIRRNDSNGEWEVKKELFQEWYETYKFLPIVERMAQEFSH